MSSVISPEMKHRARGRDLKVVFDAGAIADRVRELGAEITRG